MCFVERMLECADQVGAVTGDSAVTFQDDTVVYIS
jgi:hypothetical protein